MSEDRRPNIRFGEIDLFLKYGGSDFSSTCFAVLKSYYDWKSQMICSGAFFTSRFLPNDYKKYLYWLSLSLRLSVAVIINLALSGIVFQTSYIGYFEKFLCHMQECVKVRKMYELWPPHRHAFLHLIYCSFFYCAIRYCLHLTVLENEEEKEIQPSHRKYYLSSLVSTLIFILTLPVQRISEFHFAVIILKYIYTMLAGVIVTFICVQ